MANQQDFISRHRQSTTLWLNALNDLLALREQYDALDYGTTLTDEDFQGANGDITKTDFVAAVGSIETLNAAFETGHNSNLYKIKV